MNLYVRYTLLLALMLLNTGSAHSAPPTAYPFTWTTVVNNGDYMPTTLCDPSEPLVPPCRHFNSYNQPSVNAARLVVLRARSRGGHGQGQPVHGVYTRDMASEGPVIKILDRATLVPQPNNLGTVYHEPPSFPRIDIGSDTLATRGNHEPVWRYLANGTETRAGTNGIYTNPYGPLITGASKLGAVSEFSFFEVPEAPGTFFDVFPGAPAVTDSNILVFKGNYTVDGAGKTGVYYRDIMNAPVTAQDDTPLTPAGGTLPVVLLANNTDTLIPGTTTVFGSVAPPSAANGTAVFAGYDNEENPTLGGIYLAPLDGSQHPLTALVSVGQQVPGERRNTRFNRLSEGLSFDGRFVAFWGAWGTQTRTLILQCSLEGNAVRIAYCQERYPGGYAVKVPVHQGIFVHDIRTRQTFVVSKTTDYFDDFLYWNFSGHVPGSDEEGDGEAARWRSSAFVAVSGLVNGSLDDPRFHVAFKGRKGQVTNDTYINPVDGIYLAAGPGNRRIAPLVTTGMQGTLLDAAAVDTATGSVLPVTAMGIERDGFRGNTIVINVTMGSEETGWGGIYMTEVPE